jgi:hypothetical protein
MRDTVKTLAGLVIIAIIVVATFLYGNSQRQAQLKHDQQVKQQQQATANGGQTSASRSSATTAPSTAPTASSQPVTNTAPVQSPTSNSVQGSALNSAAPAPVKSSPAQTSAKVASGSLSTTGGVATPLPQTGSPIGSLIGVAAVIGAIVAVRHSRQAVLAAARSHRNL